MKKCNKCGHVYSVNQDRCPACHGADYQLEELYEEDDCVEEVDVEEEDDFEEDDEEAEYDEDEET